jgi:hypothetical protein
MPQLPAYVPRYPNPNNDPFIQEIEDHRKKRLEGIILEYYVEREIAGAEFDMMTRELLDKAEQDGPIAQAISELWMELIIKIVQKDRKVESLPSEKSEPVTDKHDNLYETYLDLTPAQRRRRLDGIRQTLHNI